MLEVSRIRTFDQTDSPHIVGILNLTPDSFSDGGAYKNSRTAVDAAQRMIDEGATIIDVGGESTRPGATPVGSAEEQRRILPVIERLVERGLSVSVDTIHADTADAALKEGAHIINDVSGGLIDPGMAAVVADSDATFVVSHWGGGANAAPVEGDAVAAVTKQLRIRLAHLESFGLGPARVIVDPGIGFGKSAEQNWQLIAGLPELSQLGHRIMLGHSRKRFMSTVLHEEDSLAKRDLLTGIISAYAAQRGIWGVRVHNVQSTLLAFRALEQLAPG